MVMQVNTTAFVFICLMLYSYLRFQVNESVLRPASLEPLSDLQLAEELIKQEMITMLHYDCLHHPSANTASLLQRGKTRGPASTSNNASHIAYLDGHTYQPVSPEDMEKVTHTHTHTHLPPASSWSHTHKSQAEISQLKGIFLALILQVLIVVAVDFNIGK